jgi:sec-independent protein translocase protein TatA
MFGSLGAPELLIILAIVVVIFGATRIGDIGKGIGRGIKEFRKEIREGQDDADASKKTEAQAASTTKSDEQPTETH